MDLLDLYRGSLSLRRVYVLVKGLPIDNALARAIEPDHVGWGLNEYLLAAIANDARMHYSGGDISEEHLIPTPEVQAKRDKQENFILQHALKMREKNQGATGG